MQLNVLTHGDVRDAASVFFRKVRYRAHLLAAHQSVGNANAHHEKWHGLAFAIFAANYADSVALGIHAPGAKISAHPFGRNGIKPGARELLNLIEMVPGVFGTLEAFDALSLGFDRFSLVHLSFGRLSVIRLSFGQFIWNNFSHEWFPCEWSLCVSL